MAQFFNELQEKTKTSNLLEVLELLAVVSIKHNETVHWKATIFGRVLVTVWV